MSQVTNWSLDPLLHGHLPTPVAESILGNITFLQKFYLVIMMLSITYPIVHKVLLCSFEKYREIRTRGKQIVVLHHAVEALILTISIPFFTYYMIKVNFQIHELDEVVSLYGAIAIFVAIIMMMYMMEIASRYDGMRLIVLFHHLLSCTDGFIIFLFPTSVMFKTGSILVYFIVFRWSLHVSHLSKQQSHPKNYLSWNDYVWWHPSNSSIMDRSSYSWFLGGRTGWDQVAGNHAKYCGDCYDCSSVLQIHFNLWKRSQRSAQQHSIEQHDNFDADADADADAVNVKATGINGNDSGDDEEEDIDEESQETHERKEGKEKEIATTN